MSRAYELAKSAHKGQMYGCVPYTDHLSAVNKKCYELYKDKLSEDDMYFVASLAWLHDAFEDTDLTNEQVENKMGHFPPNGWVRTTELIQAMRAISKRDSDSRSDYLKICMMNRFAHMVKIADTLCNLECSLKSMETRRINKYTNQLNKLTKALPAMPPRSDTDY